MLIPRGRNEADGRRRTKPAAVCQLAYLASSAPPLHSKPLIPSSQTPLAFLWTSTLRSLVKVSTSSDHSTHLSARARNSAHSGGWYSQRRSSLTFSPTSWKPPDRSGTRRESTNLGGQSTAESGSDSEPSWDFRRNSHLHSEADTSHSHVCIHTPRGEAILTSHIYSKQRILLLLQQTTRSVLPLDPNSRVLADHHRHRTSINQPNHLNIPFRQSNLSENLRQAYSHQSYSHFHL